jgi:GNAT superfamily N-acetyltransferase
MSLRIERARFAQDAPVVRQLFMQYQAGLGIDLCFQSFEDELRDLPGEYAEPSGAIWLAKQDSTACGCVALRPLQPHTAELKRMYVHPEARGSGAGRALMHAVLDYAREQGYEWLVLDTLSRLQPAIALYRTIGFVECERYNDNPLPDVLFMRLALGVR